MAASSEGADSVSLSHKQKGNSCYDLLSIQSKFIKCGSVQSSCRKVYGELLDKLHFLTDWTALTCAEIKRNHQSPCTYTVVIIGTFHKNKYATKKLLCKPLIFLKLNRLHTVNLSVKKKGFTAALVLVLFKGASYIRLTEFPVKGPSISSSIRSWLKGIRVNTW